MLSNEMSQQLADFKSEMGEVSESGRTPLITVPRTMRGLCLPGDDSKGDPWLYILFPLTGQLSFGGGGGQVW